METPAPLAHLLQALEVGDLAAAKAAAAALQRSGTGATQLAAEVLHELRQPLLGVKAYAQLLAEETAPWARSSCSWPQVERMEQIIARLRPALQRSSRAAAAHVAGQRRVGRGQALRAQPGLVPHLAGGGWPRSTSPCRATARLLEQLTLNLLNNARDAMGGKGRIKVLLDAWRAPRR